MAKPIRGPKDDFPESRDRDGNILTPADFDRWETPPGVMFDLENREPGAKTYDQVRETEM